MEDDKAFGIYAVTLVAAVTSALATSVMLGFASLPSPVAFVEHLSLGLMFRAAYKGIGGLDWADWSVLSEPTATVEPASETAPATGLSARPA